jgi:hypothetical protein
MVILEAQYSCIVRGYAQYNKGDRAVFSEEKAVQLLDEFPDGWRECRQEDATVKAPTAPKFDKMKRAPEYKK